MNRGETPNTANFKANCFSPFGLGAACLSAADGAISKRYTGGREKTINQAVVLSNALLSIITEPRYNKSEAFVTAPFGRLTTH
jgi:hypothetical protein